MNWLLTTALTLILVETLLRLPLIPAARIILRTSGKAVRVFSAKRVSDHWKEKAMGAYARRTLMASLRLAAWFLVVVLFGFLMTEVMLEASSDFVVFLFGWQGLLFSLAVASLYVWIRRRIVNA